MRDKYEELRKRAEGSDDEEEEVGGFVRVAEDHAFFAPRDEDEEEVEDDSEGEEDDVNFFAPRDDDEPPSAADDLVAQLRDAADWFDRLDEAKEGELSMNHFDELCEKLGLRDVLGQAEMDRQRFFADPGGHGVLRPGAALGPMLDGRRHGVLLRAGARPLPRREVRRRVAKVRRGHALLHVPRDLVTEL